MKILHKLIGISILLRSLSSLADPMDINTHREVLGYGRAEVSTGCWTAGADLRPYAQQLAEQDAKEKCQSNVIPLDDFKMEHDFSSEGKGVCKSVVTAERRYRCED